MVQGMMANKYMKTFEEPILTWNKKLNQVADVNQILSEIQRTWCASLETPRPAAPRLRNARLSVLSCCGCVHARQARPAPQRLSAPGCPAWPGRTWKHSSFTPRR
jgi:hypothetical protein